jgi:hypothetical protein
MGAWRSGSVILYFGSRQRRVVSFTSRPLYPRRKSSRNALLGGRVDPKAGLDDVE